MWGASAWSSASFLRIVNVDVERFFMKAHRAPDWIRSLRWGFVQYRSALGRLIAESGGDSAVLRFKPQVKSAR